MPFSGGHMHATHAKPAQLWLEAAHAMRCNSPTKFPGTPADGITE
jgi:hypothetical protein